MNSQLHGEKWNPYEVMFDFKFRLTIVS